MTELFITKPYLCNTSHYLCPAQPYRSLLSHCYTVLYSTIATHIVALLYRCVTELRPTLPLPRRTILCIASPQHNISVHFLCITITPQCAASQYLCIATHRVASALLCLSKPLRHSTVPLLYETVLDCAKPLQCLSNPICTIP